VVGGRGGGGGGGGVGGGGGRGGGGGWWGVGVLCSALDGINSMDYSWGDADILLRQPLVSKVWKDGFGKFLDQVRTGRGRGGGGAESPGEGTILAMQP